MICDRKRWPKLFAYLDYYGLDERVVAAIDRIKGNGYSGYYVVGAKMEDGIHIFDLSNTPDHMAPEEIEELGWSMLNDSCGVITESEWRRLTLDGHCETFTIRGGKEQ